MDKDKKSISKPMSKKLKQSPETAQLKQRAIELEEKLARSLADYSNLEKRIESQRQILLTLATASIVTKMMEVLDDLYLVQSHLKDQGLQMAVDKFQNILRSEGLEEIKADDQEFDPKFMDCVEVSEGKQNFVIEVRKKGYILNDQVVRPAQVVVGRESDDKASSKA